LGSRGASAIGLGWFSGAVAMFSPSLPIYQRCATACKQ
jgi:hypothetical protein